MFLCFIIHVFHFVINNNFHLISSIIKSSISINGFAFSFRNILVNFLSTRCTDILYRYKKRICTTLPVFRSVFSNFIQNWSNLSYLNVKKDHANWFFYWKSRTMCSTTCASWSSVIWIAVGTNTSFSSTFVTLPPALIYNFQFSLYLFSVEFLWCWASLLLDH